VNPGPIALLADDRSGGEAAQTAEIVRAALVRSFSAAAVRVRRFDGHGAAPAERGAVAVAPPDGAAELLRGFAREGRKLLLLGPLGPRVASLAGLAATAPATVSEAEAFAPAHPETPVDLSAAILVWAPDAPGGAPALTERAFCRFDFEEEWNHAGHGRIRPGATRWSLWTAPDAGAAREAARVEVAGATRGVAASRLEAPDASIFWIGRPVGLVDGLDWTAVERFFSDHRAGELPCWPSWCDWPAGFDAGATFRLDCDEAVASARPLFERYRERGVPVSLALLAGLELGEDDRRLVYDVLDAGGTVLSHSLRHLPNWGRDLAEARAEARGARERLEALFPFAAPIRFAVSPFHRNPIHAIRAVGEVYDALVTGSPASDPECLLARAGVLPFADPPLVSHSQPNMLHGDCFARQQGSTRPWQEAFACHRRAGALYGYLDHPFSPRYAYGWASEAKRLTAHDALLDTITASQRPWLPSQGRALAQLVRRAKTALALDTAGRLHAAGPDGPEPLAVRLAGEVRAV